MQLYQKQPTLIKEQLFIVLGVVLMLCSVVLVVKFTPLFGDIVFVVGVILMIYSSYKQYKKTSSVPDPTLTKIGVVFRSVGLIGFIGIVLIIMIIINIVK